MASSSPGILRRLFGYVTDCGKVVVTSFFNVVVVVGIAAALFVVPQAQDLLRNLAESGNRVRFDSLISFVFGALVWAAAAWYWTRVVLKLSKKSPEGQSVLRRFLQRNFPRYLGTGGLICIGAALLKSRVDVTDVAQRRGLLGLGVVFFILAAVFYAVTRYRRPVQDAIHARLKSEGGLARGIRRLTEPEDAEARYPSFSELPWSTRFATWVSVAVCVLLLLGVTLSPHAFGLRFGAPAILFCAGAAAVFFGALIAYGSLTLKIPLLTVLILVVYVFSHFNDNHEVRKHPRRPEAVRQDIFQHYRSWSAGMPASSPVFLVAAEGGGIRAAYWTATVLGHLQDVSPSFSRQLYAISGVSGGSLGGAVFAAVVRDADACTESSKDCCQDALGRDFLSPTLAKMVGPDFVQRLLPVGWSYLDRSIALEQSWERSYRIATGRNTIADPFLDLWRRGEGDPTRTLHVPSLYLNSTHVESGRRILISNVSWPGRVFRDTFDLHELLDGEDIALSTAVHNSARFTFVSPAGTIRDGRRELQGHLVDGGYFENSGTTTALDLFHMIKGVDPDRTVYGILISNDPESRPVRVIDPSEMEEPPKTGLIESLSPVRTLLRTRSARGSYAITTFEAALNAQGGDAPHFFQVGLCVETPLGWKLSESAQVKIDAQLSEGCADYDNAAALDKIADLLRADEPGNSGLTSF